jgi:ABC-2 type transport system ATP-binding protein
MLESPSVRYVMTRSTTNWTRPTGLPRSSEGRTSLSSNVHQTPRTADSGLVRGRLPTPFNGLDPDGIASMPMFLRQFADNGGTVFLSSYLLTEVAHSADDAIIIDRGRLVTAGPIAGLLPESNAITVTSPDADRLAVTLGKRGATVRRTTGDRLAVQDMSAELIGRAAVEAGAVIVELRADGPDLETIFESLIHPKEHV